MHIKSWYIQIPPPKKILILEQNFPQKSVDLITSCLSSEIWQFIIFFLSFKEQDHFKRGVGCVDGLFAVRQVNVRYLAKEKNLCFWLLWIWKKHLTGFIEMNYGSVWARGKIAEVLIVVIYSQIIPQTANPSTHGSHSTLSLEFFWHTTCVVMRGVAAPTIKDPVWYIDRLNIG